MVVVFMLVVGGTVVVVELWLVEGGGTIEVMFVLVTLWVEVSVLALLKEVVVTLALGKGVGVTVVATSVVKPGVYSVCAITAVTSNRNLQRTENCIFLLND